MGIWSKKVQLANGITTPPNGMYYANGKYMMPYLCFSTSTFEIRTSLDGVTWDNAYTTSNIMYFVRYGNGLYLSGGEKGVFYTSTDAINWTQQTISTTYTIWDACYGNGTYLLVTDNDGFLTSTDGTTWTKSKPFSDLGYTHSCMYSNGMFLVFSSIEILTSTDAINWTRHPVSSQVASCAYGNGIYVAIGNGVYTSTDGATWTQQNSTGINDYYGNIVFGNGVFVAVSNGGHVMASTDGITWETTNVCSYLDSVCTNGTEFLAMSNDGSIYSATQVITPTYNVNGINYQPTIDPSNVLVYKGTYSGDIVIPSTIDNGGTTYNVTEIGDNAFDNASGLTSIALPTSLTKIGDYAFQNCSGLTSITIPSSVTTIGMDAFQNCLGLTSIVIPSGVTEIKNSAFYNCANITSLSISDTVTTIGESAFSQCMQISTNIVVPESVTNMGWGAFWNCPATFNVSSQRVGMLLLDSGVNISNILVNGNPMTIPVQGVSLNYDTVSLKVGSYTSLYASINPNNATNPSVTWSSSDPTVATVSASGQVHAIIEGNVTITCTTNDGGFTDSCIVTVSDWVFDLSTGTIIKYIGSNQNITIPSVINGVAMTKVENNCFNNSTSLLSVTFPDSIISVGSSAFYNCSNLTTITMTNNVTTIGDYAFYGCRALVNITFPVSVLSSCTTENWFNGCQNLVNVVLPNGITTIGSYMFYGCNKLTSVNIPNTVTTIRDSAFYNCYLLNMVTIPSSVTYIGSYVFYYCYGMKGTLTLPSGLTYMGTYAFYDCYGITGTITVPGTLTTISYGAFQNCSSITGLVISEGVQSISQYAFEYCYALQNVTLPNSLTSIGDYAFYCDNNLKSLTIPSKVTNIGNYAFYGCTYIASALTLPEGLLSIGNYAFYNCYNIPNIIIPKTVIYIYDSAFASLSKCIWIRVDCPINVFTQYTSNTNGRVSMTKEIFTYYELSGHTLSELPSSPPPTTPSYINTNITTSDVSSNDTVIVTWGASTDVLGSVMIYDLYFYDGSNWSLIANDTTNCSFTHTIPSTPHNVSNAQYKVVAYNNYLYSSYISSSTFKIYGSENEAPIVNDIDKDFGEFENLPTTITYSIDDENYKDIESVYIKVNRTSLNKVDNVTLNVDYQIDLSSVWDNLVENEVNYIKIMAYDGKEYSNLRTYTFKRIKYYPPKVSGYNTTLGKKDSLFKLTYSIHDKFKQSSLTVIEKIDSLNYTIRENCVRDKVYEIDLIEIWFGLSDGWHTISISVTDERGGSDTREYKFYKGENVDNIDNISLIKYNYK